MHVTNCNASLHNGFNLLFELYISSSNYQQSPEPNYIITIPCWNPRADPIQQDGGLNIILTPFLRLVSILPLSQTTNGSESADDGGLRLQAETSSCPEVIAVHVLRGDATFDC